MLSTHQASASPTREKACHIPLSNDAENLDPSLLWVPQEAIVVATPHVSLNNDDRRAMPWEEQTELQIGNTTWDIKGGQKITMCRDTDSR